MSGKRYILITGTSRGLGRYLAEHYLAQGDFVIGCARSEAVGGGSISHEHYRHYQVDVTDALAVHALLREVQREMGRLDVLINNAGVANMNPLALTPVEVARRIMETNFLGTFVLSQAAIRLLRKSPAPRIVNLSSIAVPLRLAGEAVYASSKSAIETLTRVAARELGAFGITCNAVGPTPIDTDLLKGVGTEKIRRLVEQQAIPHMAQPRDVAHVVDFFLHPESHMITGQVIYLGGLG
jgi:3-oxoacyl-[acyl-carrier protein] reductase